MSIKRKRSNPSFCPAPTSFDFSTSPTRLPEFFTQSKPLDQSCTYSWKETTSSSHSQYDDSTSQTNSRTQKRYRDGRPDEATVHSSTMQKLFQAQRQHPNASPLPSQSQFQQPQSFSQSQQPQLLPPAQKSTLHSFWQLPNQTIHQEEIHHPTPRPAFILKCEDCDNVLSTNTNEDMVDTDIDSDTACGECGKRVCDTCAVVRDTRLCLDCAMK